jgi:hypothetical protein
MFLGVNHVGKSTFAGDLLATLEERQRPTGIGISAIEFHVRTTDAPPHP